MIELAIETEQEIALARSAVKRYSAVPKILPIHKRVIETVLIELRRVGGGRWFALLSNREAEVLKIALLREWEKNVRDGEYLIAKRACKTLLFRLGHEWEDKQKKPLRKKEKADGDAGNRVRAESPRHPVERGSKRVGRVLRKNPKNVRR